MKNIGLILEGGGMRGAYTAGILDGFMDEGIDFPYIIGVSSGATIGASYVSGQKERSKRIYLDWSSDNRFFGFGNVLREKSLFGMDFLFDLLPNRLETFRYDRFKASDKVLYSCVSNCENGEVEYIRHDEHCPKYYMNYVIRACNSLPIISPHVHMNGKRYLDGFLTDPMPIYKSMEDGNDRNVIVMTKKPGIEKKISLMDKFLKRLIQLKYPKVGIKLTDTGNEYLRRLKVIEKMEEEGKAFVFRPQNHRLESRYDRTAEALQATYADGYDDAVSQAKALREWLDDQPVQESDVMESKLEYSEETPEPGVLTHLQP